MIPQAIRNRLSPKELIMLECLIETTKLRGITISFADEELIFKKKGRSIKKEPLSSLKKLSDSLVSEQDQ